MCCRSTRLHRFMCSGTFRTSACHSSRLLNLDNLLGKLSLSNLEPASVS
jgi:hypothetical protein